MLTTEETRPIRSILESDQGVYVPLERGGVTITANEQALRDDFLREASTRPDIDMDRAQECASKLRVFLDRDSFLQHEAKTNKLPPQSLLHTVQSTLVNSVQKLTDLTSRINVAGLADPYSDMPCIFINPANTLNLFTPKGAHAEIQQAALRQGLEQVWMHEREHLLQGLKPGYKDHVIKQNKQRLTVSMLATGALVAFGITQFIANPSQLKFIAFEVSTIVEMLGVDAMTKTIWYAYMNRDEKEARLAEKQDKRNNLPSLFNFSFEQ